MRVACFSALDDLAKDWRQHEVHRMEPVFDHGFVCGFDITTVCGLKLPLEEPDRDGYLGATAAHDVGFLFAPVALVPGATVPPWPE